MLLLKILILALLRCWKALRRRSHLNETDKFQFSLLIVLCICFNAVHTVPHG
jgi:hypothetical protein